MSLSGLEAGKLEGIGLMVTRRCSLCNVERVGVWLAGRPSSRIVGRGRLRWVGLVG